MAITKSKLFSLHLFPDVVAEECRLWHRFVDNHQGIKLENFLPKQSDGDSWHHRIVLYTQDNREQFLPIMDRLSLEMEQQNEHFAPIYCSAVEAYSEMTLTAVRLLGELNGNLKSALSRLVGRIVIVECEELVGCSSALFLGLIIIAPKKHWTIYEYMENIIHEMSHVELYMKQLVDPLTMKGSYLNSPFRKKLRPASGVYHAAFVLARIILLLAPLSSSSEHSTEMEKRLDAWRLMLHETLSQFHGEEILTPAGESLFNEMCGLTENLAPLITVRDQG